MDEELYSQIYPFFDEGDYLAFNPDVADAVNKGIVASALDHLINFGQFEDRVPTFTGTTGNDFIRGVGTSSYFYPTAYEIVSTNPYDFRVIGTGAGEIDTLEGGTGADNFALGAYTVPSVPNAVQFYLGQGNNDYALIQKFRFGEDIIQLAGSPADYTQEVSNGDLYIYRKNPRDLVAVIDGIASPLSLVDRPQFSGDFYNGLFSLGAVNYFDEPDYLIAHADVRQAVENGTIASGYEHYVNFGQFEGRAVTFTGTTGNDVIRSFGSGARYIFGTPYEVVSGEPYDFRAIGTGTGEIDTLIGAPGADNFSIASYSVPSSPTAFQLYLGQGNSDYALIQNFERGVDFVEVLGSVSNFTQEVMNGSLNIYSNSPSRDLVAIVQGVTSPLVEVQSAAFRDNPGTIYLG